MTNETLGSTPQYSQRIEEWKQKTTAQIIDVATFEAIKQREQLHVAGVAGFSGKWENSPLKGEELEKLIADMRLVILQELSRLQTEHGERLIVVSGATNRGVLQLTYEACESLKIRAMGITSDATLKYDVGKMEYLIPIGKDWGEESPAFISLSDEFIIIGGGNQAKREVEAGSQAGKPVTVVRGFGGTADVFTPAEIPNGRFIEGRDSK
jgi:hypothetical protein